MDQPRGFNFFYRAMNYFPVVVVGQRVSDGLGVQVGKGVRVEVGLNQGVRVVLGVDVTVAVREGVRVGASPWTRN